MNKEAEATPPEQSEPSQAAELTQELEKETEDSKLKSEEPNLDDKYSSSFETASCDIDGNIIEKLESGVGVVITYKMAVFVLYTLCFSSEIALQNVK